MVENLADQSKFALENDTYPSWDLSIRDLPPRTLLTSPAPLNIGTNQVESLLSYISRTAFEHYVTPNTMLKYVISHTNKELDLMNKIILSNRINGMEFRIKILVHVLQKLTNRNNLYYTTILGWEQKISSSCLLKTEKMWCPICFVEQKDQLDLNYDKLIWSLQPIKHCSLHQIPLKSHCPDCHQSFDYTQVNLPGYCSICFKWLGERNYLKTQEISVGIEEPKFEELSTKSHLHELSSKRGRFIYNLADFISRLAFGNIYEFSRIVGVNDNKIRRILDGKMLPTWDILNKISFRLQIPILNILTGRNLDLKHIKISNKDLYNYFS